MLIILPARGCFGSLPQVGHLKHSAGCESEEGSLCLSSLMGGGEGGSQAGEPQDTAGSAYLTVFPKMCQALEAPDGSN